MPQIKVSGLTALTATDGAEELLINDGGISKKVTIDNALHDNSIRSEHYVDGSIDREHLAADIVDGTKIADDVINSEHIAADSIDAEHLNVNSVNTDAIIDDAVRTAHIQNAQVTVAKMAANSVDSDQYVDGSIDTAHIGNDQVTADKLANSINTDIATGVTGNTTANAALPKAGGTMTGHTLHGDNINQKFGADDDLQIYHNGSNSYINNTTGSLYIRDSAGDIYIQAKNNEHSIVANNDGSVDIYYDNAKKFETTAAGVTVTGNVNGLAITTTATSNIGLGANAVDSITGKLVKQQLRVLIILLLVNLLLVQIQQVELMLQLVLVL